LRQPFPGGFEGDNRNAFTERGRTEFENDIYNYLHELLKLRNEYSVLSKGKLRHIYPADNLYILEKFYEDDNAIIIINSGDKDISFDYSQIKSYLPEAKMLFNLKSEEGIILKKDSSIKIYSMDAQIFLVNKTTSESNKK